jgi:hypothetical protein
MPMDGGSLVGQFVLNLNLDPVTPVGLNGWTWEGTVHNKTLLGNSVGSDILVRDNKLVLASHAGVWDVFVWVAVGSCNVGSPWRAGASTRHVTGISGSILGTKDRQTVRVVLR